MMLRSVDIEPEDAIIERSWNEHAIARLEEWLEAAKRGELRELVMVGVFEDEHGETPRWTATGTKKWTARVGLLEMVKHELLTEYMGEAE